MLTITIRGVREFELKLEALARALDINVILDQSAALLLSRIRQRFLNETDPSGAKWKPSLAAQLRAAAGEGGGTLYDTGRLFKSIQLFASEPDSRAIGTDVPYGVFHQLGTRHMSARVFLGFNEEDSELVQRFLIRRVEQALR